jgi:tRNA threonylcarbamoyl adenosine modification protein YeaZ
LNILSFDSSTAELHLSLSEAGRVKASKIVSTDTDRRRYAASEIIPAINSLLREQGWKNTEVDAVVVGVGPGSFTGVRVGVVTARTIGQALKLPVLGVSLFDCYAHLVNEPIGIVLDAGGGYFYVASYGCRGGGNYENAVGAQLKDLAMAKEPECLKLEELSQGLADGRRWLVSPSLLERLRESSKKAEPLPVLNNIATLQSEIAIYRLSLREFPKVATGDRISIREKMMAEFPYALVKPLYLRQASITLKSVAS